MEFSVRYKDNDIEYTLIRSRRKTIGISIKPGKGVHVSSPQRVSDRYIQDIVLKKGEWILRKLEEMKSRCAHDRQFISGEELSVLGKSYVLEIKRLTTCQKIKIHLDDSRLVIFFPETEAGELRRDLMRKALEEWLKDTATKIVSERLSLFSETLNLKPNKIYFKSQKTIWGSCTRNNNININWRIVMAPQEIVDYLVVHELLHIRVKNHSKAFWDEMKKVLPDYIERRRWLKNNGNRLII